MVWLEGSLLWDAQVGGLVPGELGQLGSEMSQVKGSDLLVEFLGEEVDTEWVFGGVVPQLELGEHLVGEGVGHDEAGMSHGTSEVDETSLGEEDQVTAVLHCVTVNLEKYKVHY